MVPTQIIEDAIRQILSQNEMFNSKAIQKEMESNHKTVLSDSSITKIWKIWDIRMQIQLMTQAFKSSDGSQRKWTKESSLANWNNAIYIDEVAFYGGDVTHKKWVSVSEEYSVKITRAKFKCNVFGWIHITGISTFELSEGDFNSNKFLDMWEGTWSLSNKYEEKMCF